MLIERKTLKIMIYNQLVEAHNFLCENDDFNDRTEVAPSDYYEDKTQLSKSKKINPVQASQVIKSLEDHLETQYEKITDERKQWLRDNIDSIDMIFDPISPSERAFLVNLRAEQIMQRIADAKQSKKDLEINSQVDDIIAGYDDLDPEDSTFPPLDPSMYNKPEDTISMSRSGDDESTFYDINNDDEDTKEDTWTPEYQAMIDSGEFYDLDDDEDSEDNDSSEDTFRLSR